MESIDLRSDTVTQPNPAMRKAMADAEVGDDVYGEDPTVNRLEERGAALAGKPAALFVPSGTMANQIAIRVQTRPGDVVLGGEHAHVLRYESGAAAAFSGVQIQTLGEGGFFDERDLRAAVLPKDVHNAPATLVCLENTHNVSGGRVWPDEQLRSVVDYARSRGLRVHLDGARLFNAAAATGRGPDVIAEGADTVSFCLSKGLGAPVGSLLCGDAETIEEGRRVRKMFGGGMRQAGILAAAGLYALDHNVDRLEDDHTNARTLTRGLADLGLTVDEPETNIVVLGVPEDRFANVPDARTLSAHARERGVLISPVDRRRLRAVTHLDAPSPRISEALERLASFLS